MEICSAVERCGEDRKSCLLRQPATSTPSLALDSGIFRYKRSFRKKWKQFLNHTICF